MRPALFLDRDGVINIEKDYLYRIDDFEFIHGIFPTLRKASSCGYALIIVTNQAGIARGYYSEEDYIILRDWLFEEFAKQEIKIDAEYFCPHHPSCKGPYGIECECRKPKPGMLISASHDYDIDLKSSIMVGDKESDIGAGFNAGVRRLVLVRSGHVIDETHTLATEIINSIADLAI
jgi:D-glycero-D-manno-heptose 1,7-bisphosphate phosphatase